MGLAKEGIREMLLATVVLGAAAWGLSMIHWAAALPMLVVWGWAISFFRDPKREATFVDGEMCAPADGTVTEVTHLDHDDRIAGPAIHVGIFLSIFNVHANRAPCAGTVRDVRYKPGRFLDARNPESGALNESNTVVLDVESPHKGPVVVRQVSGLLARRIVCHADVGTRLARGQRFGMIKFGSRTELIVPAEPGTEVVVQIGDKVHAGLTVLLRQPLPSED